MKSVQIRKFFWSVFPRNRTEYGDSRSKSTYSVWIWEYGPRKTPYLGTSCSKVRKLIQLVLWVKKLTFPFKQVSRNIYEGCLDFHRNFMTFIKYSEAPKKNSWKTKSVFRFTKLLSTNKIWWVSMNHQLKMTFILAIVE